MLMLEDLLSKEQRTIT